MDSDDNEEDDVGDILVRENLLWEWIWFYHNFSLFKQPAWFFWDCHCLSFLRVLLFAVLGKNEKSQN